MSGLAADEAEAGPGSAASVALRARPWSERTDPVRLLLNAGLIENKMWVIAILTPTIPSPFALFSRRNTMKEPINARLVAGAMALTLGGGVSIVADG